MDGVEPTCRRNRGYGRGQRDAKGKLGAEAGEAQLVYEAERVGRPGFALCYGASGRGGGVWPRAAVSPRRQRAANARLLLGALIRKPVARGAWGARFAQAGNWSSCAAERGCLHN